MGKRRMKPGTKKKPDRKTGVLFRGVVDRSSSGVGYSGVSASEIVGYLSDYHREEEEEEEEEVGEEREREDFGGYPFVRSSGLVEEEEEREVGERILRERRDRGGCPFAGSCGLGEKEEEDATMAGEREDFGGDPVAGSCGLVGGGEGEVEGGMVEIGIGGEDEMGFYKVEFVWEYVDEEDWCVVGEM